MSVVSDPKSHFATGVFRPGADSNTFITIDRDYSGISNPELRREMFDRIFHPIFTVVDGTPQREERRELLDHYLKKTARVMAGCVEDKEWLVGQGYRKCGTGVLSDLIGNTLQGYVSATNSECLTSKSFGGGDVAKANSFMMDFEFKRQIICNELSIEHKGETVLDGNKIKKVHSGGDFIEGRRNYQDERRFRVQCSLFFNLNDVNNSSKW